MIRINLLTGERQVRKVAAPFELGQKLTLACSLILLAAALVVGWRFWTLREDSARLDAAISEAQAETSRLHSIIAQVQQFEQRRTQLQQRVALIEQLRRDHGTTVVLTTHLMDEAARCDRLAILDGGHIVAAGSPAELTRAIGGEVIVLTSADPARLRDRIRERFTLTADIVDDRVRLERPGAHDFVAELVKSLPDDIDSVTFGKPTLEDVFVHHTGRRLD